MAIQDVFEDLQKGKFVRTMISSSDSPLHQTKRAICPDGQDSDEEDIDKHDDKSESEAKRKQDNGVC